MLSAWNNTSDIVYLISTHFSSENKTQECAHPHQENKQGMHGDRVLRASILMIVSKKNHYNLKANVYH